MPVMSVAKRIVLLCLSSTVVLHAQTGPNDPRAREIYKELVEINTTDTPAGNVTKAADAIKGAVMRETKGMAKTETVQRLLLLELDKA
jgi:hypothetical protein